MIYKQVFNLTGTDQQQAIVKKAIDKIMYPWETLKFPCPPVEIGWRDLNDGTYMNDPQVHAIGGKLDKHAPMPRHHAREYIFGVMYPSTGTMYIDNWLVNRPDLAESTVSAEIAHNVDYFKPLTDTQKEAIIALTHEGKPVEPGHIDTWWEQFDYAGEYFTLVGEAFMQAFTVAYSDIPFDNSGFTHGITKEQAPKLRAIIGIERTDNFIPPPALRHFEVFGKSKIYHTPMHYTKTDGVLITDTTGLRPCKICKPLIQ